MELQDRRTTRRAQMLLADFLEALLLPSRTFRSALFPGSDPLLIFAVPIRLRRHCRVPSFRIPHGRLLQRQVAILPRWHFPARFESAVSLGARIFLLFPYDHLGISPDRIAAKVLPDTQILRICTDWIKLQRACGKCGTLI